MLGFVPTGSIQYHHDELSGMAGRYLPQKQTHRLRVDLRQHERIQYAIVRAHRRIGILVLARDLGWHRGPYACRSPAASRLKRPKRASSANISRTGRPSAAGDGSISSWT